MCFLAPQRHGTSLLWWGTAKMGFLVCTSWVRRWCIYLSPLGTCWWFSLHLHCSHSRDDYLPNVTLGGVVRVRSFLPFCFDDWWFNIALYNGLFIDDLIFPNCDLIYSHIKLPQGVFAMRFSCINDVIRSAVWDLHICVFCTWTERINTRTRKKTRYSHRTLAAKDGGQNCIFKCAKKGTKNYFLRVIPTVKHYPDIASDIPSGSIYGIFIRNIRTFYLTCILTLSPAFYLASFLAHGRWVVFVAPSSPYACLPPASPPSQWHLRSEHAEP